MSENGKTTQQTRREFKSLMVANRGEIAIRVLRAASELKIRTFALYTFEDRYSLHRYKADESYQIGPRDEPLKPYLDIDEIIHLAKRKNIDAIHPGYGFLSENVEFASECERNGITFIGPSPDSMLALGDKIRGKEMAQKAGVPIIESSRIELKSVDDACSEAEKIGYPLLIKASGGGGGRGMRVVQNREQLISSFNEARKEALNAFGNDTVFLERFIADPRHVEVQILGDKYGNLIHLFERDCSVQRRFQKVVEVSPCSGISDECRKKLYDYALAIARSAGYYNAGTVEFLVDADENIFFIEVNPRIQVEHTVTEQTTGVDIVRSQILIAEGGALSDPGIHLHDQSQIRNNGYAIQCRITTEDPENDFRPDYGTIITYRSPGGFGIRLDAGSAYSGMAVSPFFDSLLVKVTASGRTLLGACERLERALREFRIRGVKTNIPFLINVVSHPAFRSGETTVNFIKDNPELLEFEKGRDRANKILYYLADVIVNGNPDVSGKTVPATLRPLPQPETPVRVSAPAGTRQRLDELGPEVFCKEVREEPAIHYTDTTFRDAHQSLLATRIRTIDMLRVAESFAKANPQIFSLEVWGGATFDVALRFLHECPWERLQRLREAIPNILFQMLLRGSNGVGYSAYPDNLIESFIEKSWENGVDIFRIFDSMNWFPNMEFSIKVVRERTKGIAQAAICYSGDFTSPTEKKFTLEYYLDMARRLEDCGAHMLAVKDMAGLLKPLAAYRLISELKKAVHIPIHLHTHDTSSLGPAIYLKAIDAGVDVIDLALGSMSGLTSQPNFNSVVAMLEGHPRERKMNQESLNQHSNYWEAVRECYQPFESGLNAGTAEVFIHEIPGGQYSNLRPQARALGLEDKFELIKKNYVAANRLLGGVIKVTPSSKVVGDLAMFMTSNGYSEKDIEEKASEISFPDSVKQFFRGDLGQPHGGFPPALQAAVLKGEKPFSDRPNEHLEALDLPKEYDSFKERFPARTTYEDFLSFMLYPKVFEQFYAHYEKCGNVSVIPSPAFFFGFALGKEVRVEIAEGKKLIIELQYIGEANDEGQRAVYFKLNGQSRGVIIKDNSIESSVPRNKKVSGSGDIGSPLQGKLSAVLVEVGDTVEKGTPLFVIEAMKMETTVTASGGGKVAKLHLEAGSLVSQDDLIVELTT